MLKNKFQRLKKEEKKEAIKKYYETKIGKENKARFMRLMITGFLCIAIGAYSLIDAIIKESSIWDYTIGVFILLFGLFFLIARHKVLVIKVNDYLVKKK